MYGAYLSKSCVHAYIDMHMRSLAQSSTSHQVLHTHWIVPDHDRDVLGSTVSIGPKGIGGFSTMHIVLRISILPIITSYLSLSCLHVRLIVLS